MYIYITLGTPSEGDSIETFLWIPCARKFGQETWYLTSRPALALDLFSHELTALAPEGYRSLLRPCLGLIWAPSPPLPPSPSPHKNLVSLFRAHLATIWLWVKNWAIPKWNPGKWQHGPKPVVPWWFNFDPHPFETCGFFNTKIKLDASIYKAAMFRCIMHPDP